MVGAVLVRDGVVVGEGFHRQVGGPHAEVEALHQAGHKARGATLYVNLEPCSHHGRTPPCADAVIAAGVTRLVACHRDPNPLVAGRGFRRLQAAGIEVESGFLLEAAVRLNWRFLAATVFSRPAVTVKWAMSLDGKIATSSGESQWISSPGGRKWGLALRESHDAIVVGSGTVLADDPRLDRRLGRAGDANVRVILDRRLRILPGARLFQIPGEVLVYTEVPAGDALRKYEGQRGEVVSLAEVSPPAVLADLYRRGIRSLLVEGGAEIAGVFVASGCFDRVSVDCAPKLIGGVSAPGPLGGEGSASLASAPRLADMRARRRDGDLIIDGFKDQCLQDLYASVDG